MTGTSRRTGTIQASRHRELAKRTASAVILAALALALTYAGLWPFTIMIAAGCTILAYEWRTLIRGKVLDAGFYVHAMSTLAACAFAASGAAWAGLAALGAGACAATLAGKNSKQRLWSAFGVLYPGLAGLLLIIFRADTAYGIAAILFLFVVVWSADTAAYFTGRTFGGPKLAPAVSPGKTWSGFAGGLIAPAIFCFVFAHWLGGTWPVILALAGAGLALASQLGDLAESFIKRTYRVKDTGHILPGHGGLFDRVDGLIGATLAAGCIMALRDLSNPGKALLIWP